jgi:large subunit ribosomal protein L38
MSLTAFFRNRFYEMDRWYKARIDKPAIYPTCYVIDPNQFTKSLAERLKDFEYPNRQMINIGLPFEEIEEKKSEEKKAPKPLEERRQLEQLARFNKLQLDVKAIQASCSEEYNIKRRKFFAEHFNIFQDLFHEDAYFYPVVDMQISYADQIKSKDDKRAVIYGNIFSPDHTQNPPSVSFIADPDTLWTLILTNPDGNVYEEGKEVLHWMIGNIPGNKIEEGELLCDYLQPLPLRQTGFHRMVFLLFKQEKRLDFAKFHLAQPCNDLIRRTFSTPDFYLKHQDSITPAGVSYFQTTWDNSCTKCFHERLNMEQPLYSYEYPEPHFEPQKEFPPELTAFNEYLDRYRDYKDIDKEILLKRLKRISPFQPNIKLAKFPNLMFKEEKDTLPTWLHVEKVKEHAGYGKYKGIYENPIQ